MLFFFSGPRQFECVWHGVTVWIAEGVHANDGQFTGVLSHLVGHALVLNLAALIACLHRAQDAAALGDTVELLQDSFFEELGQFFDDETTLAGVFIFRQAPLAVDDELNGHGTAHRLFGGRGDGLIKGVGVQAVAVVVDRNQGLQCRANVIELNLLRVQAAAAGLDVVLQLLTAFIGTIFFAHGHRPYAARDSAQHGVLGVHAVAEEERQVGRKVIDVHAAG